MSIWNIIEKKFGKSEKKLKVVKTFIKYGFSIKNGKIFCDKIKIPYMSIANACGVDRRTVKEVVKIISENSILKEFFEKIEPAGPFLKNVSRFLGYRCIIVEPFRDEPGIIASVSSVIASKNINIVQIIAEDPYLYENPKLYIIVEGKFPGEMINEIINLKNIRQVTTL